MSSVDTGGKSGGQKSHLGVVSPSSKEIDLCTEPDSPDGRGGPIGSGQLALPERGYEWGQPNSQYFMIILGSSITTRVYTQKNTSCTPVKCSHKSLTLFCLGATAVLRNYFQRCFRNHVVLGLDLQCKVCVPVH